MRASSVADPLRPARGPSRRWPLAAAWALLAWGIGAGAQQAPPADPAAPPPAVDETPAVPPPPALPSEALGEYVDGVVSAYLRRDGIAGAAVAVVDRNGVLLLRGYGQAALDPPRAVDPAMTLFRLGSISKTFAYVAAMQLVEQGRLDLEAEANRYLPPDLQLPDDGYAPVRVRHLMTHTAGFEDSVFGHLFALAPEQVMPVREYLRTWRPRRVRAPDQYAVYSNYSVALLGALVANVAGQTFERQVETGILEPLGMRQATFREPLPAGDPRAVADALKPSWTTGFERSGGGYVAKPFEYISQSGADGAGSASAEAMGRYMRMLLGGGTLDGATILKPQTFATLTTVDVRNAEAVGGIAHGFFRRPFGRYESLEHDGATLFGHASMVLLPDAGVGIFVAANTDTGRRLVRELPQLVFAHFLEDARPAPVPLPPQGFAANAGRYAGSYIDERRAHTTLEKLLLTNAVEVAVTDDGYLVVGSGEGARRYAADGDDIFRSTEDGQRIAFLRDAEGRVTGYANAYGHTVSRRVGVLETPAALGGAAGVVALASLAVLLGSWRRWGRPQRSLARNGRGVAVVLNLGAVAWLLFLAAAGVALIALQALGEAAILAYPTPAIRTAVVIAYVAAALSVLAALLLPQALRARGWTFGRKLRHVVVVLVMIAMVVFLVHWNVLLAPLALA
ncbi:serine hydrolase domain-containing protein [Dokdonella koreensis]|uniref:Beta-lactamase n=1 Tax=Dokdonella koreensis DS-123 TaxID=1300342 RepID=A0A160DSW7_9GAMM|nr:serine hydrolase domain-containing protein [Dokdonella koreensis]ANB17020.1 Beta-lactamase [Dokdonella koreensis DS-123]